MCVFDFLQRKHLKRSHHSNFPTIRRRYDQGWLGTEDHKGDKTLGRIMHATWISEKIVHLIPSSVPYSEDTEDWTRKTVGEGEER